MEIGKHLEADIKYFEEQEELFLTLRDSNQKYSEDYNYYQRLFGIHYRARIRAQREYTRFNRGEATGFG